MRMIWFRIIIAVVIFGLGNVLNVMAQINQDDLWLEETPCFKTPDKSITRLLGNGKFKICFDYNPVELTPGVGPDPRKTLLTISIYTKLGKENARIANLSILEKSEHPGVAVALRSGPEAQPSLKLSTANVYKYDLTIDDQAKPHPYRLKMLLTYAGTLHEEYYELPISISGKGLLEGSKSNPPTLSCWTGEQHTLKLGVINNSTYYPITVQQVKVYSEPDVLVKDATLQVTETVNTDGVPKDLDIPFAINRMSPMQLLSGFGKSPKLRVNVYYKDSFDRSYYLPLVMDLDLKPEPLYLILALLIGALLGMVLRIDLYRLEKSGFISRKQKLFFAGGAALTGVVISIVAIAANLKLVMFGDQSGYSSFDPRLLLLIALVGTMGGAALLNPLLPLPKSQARFEGERVEDKTSLKGDQT
jgi:hypothetical protein